jgi:predicted PurR-regulated permease PerM
MPNLEPADRNDRLVRAVLLLGVAALFFTVVGQLAGAFFFFGDLVLTFFLAWLLAFIISPIATRLTGLTPRLPRAGAAMIVYALVLTIPIVVAVVAAGALATSATQFVASIPDIQASLPTIVAPWQDLLISIGLGQVDLVGQASEVLANLDDFAGALVEPLQQIAVASLSGIGTMLIVVILSIYMVVDRDGIMSFLFRLVPPTYAEEALLLQSSISRSFGGFLRGQALLGIVYFLIAVATHLLLNLPLAPLSAVSAGVLMAIPFFGPFLAWAPPVVIALLLQPTAVLPTVLAMGAGWVVVMNVLQPRIMQDAVGIHPIVVLGSVLVGSRIAGIPGAIFGIPIAAVASAFFLHFLQRASGNRTVVGRAARRVAAREGRPVHMPREPAPGSAVDIDEAGSASGGS